MKAADLKNKPPNIIIYGPAGSGKTALVSQASSGYMMDFDDGMKTAKSLDDKFSSLRRGIEFDTFSDENPLKPHAWLDARKKIQDIVEQAQTNEWKYDAIIIDSLTGMGKSIMLHVMACSGNAYAKPQIQHWGSMVQEMETALTMIRAIRTLRLTTAHELVLDKDGTDVFSPMSITKRHSAEKLMWLFDECLYAEVRRGVRGAVNFVVTGKPSGSHRCRTRSGFSDDLIHNDCGLKGVLERMEYNYGKS